MDYSFLIPASRRFFPFCPLNRKENHSSLCDLCDFAVINNFALYLIRHKNAQRSSR